MSTDNRAFTDLMQHTESLLNFYGAKLVSGSGTPPILPPLPAPALLAPMPTTMRAEEERRARDKISTLRIAIDSSEFRLKNYRTLLMFGERKRQHEERKESLRLLKIQLAEAEYALLEFTDPDTFTEVESMLHTVENQFDQLA